VAAHKRTALHLGAWLCWEDEAGQSLRPPKATTWAPRGRTPLVQVRGKGYGRVALAGLVWDNDRRHLSRAMRTAIEVRSRWLTVFHLPAYAPELNPAEGVWANLKHGLANLTPRDTDQLATVIKTKLKRMQYRHGLLDGFIAQTGLTLQPP
jgi:putative transposase